MKEEKEIVESEEKPKIAIDSPNVQNLVNSVFLVYNTPRTFFSASQFFQLIRQFCRLFGEKKKAQSIFDLWLGRTTGVAIPKIEAILFKMANNPNVKKRITIKGKACSKDDLYILLEVEKSKAFDIFFDLIAEHGVSIPVQWAQFNPKDVEGLPELGGKNV